MVAFDMGEIANLALLGAIGVVGYQLYVFERRYKKDKEKQAFENARAVNAVSEGRVLLEQLKNETARLQKEKARAQDAVDQLSVIISEAEAEAENSERITAELKSAAKAADRTCSKITDVVSAAAELHRVIKPALEDMPKVKPAPARRQGVLREKPLAARLPRTISDDQGANVVKFPVAN